MLRGVADMISVGSKNTIMYANVHVVNQAQSDPDLLRIINGADLVYPDGHGVVLGARLMGNILPPRMTGADWIHDLCRFAAENHYSLYIVAGEPGVAEKAREELQRHYKGLDIIGTHDGFFHSRGESRQLIEDINEKKPHIVLIGMGTPIQEKFTGEWREQMDVPVCWVVGALFDYITGKARRGPQWMLDHGMEWMCRLVFEPRRLWKRYIIGNSLFLMRILLLRVKSGN